MNPFASRILPIGAIATATALIFHLPAAESPEGRHLKNVRQLTFGGENAEAYFSLDASRLIFQSTRNGQECDQIYTMRTDGTDVKMVSTGKGRTTCAFFYPQGDRILYSSTHLSSPACPPKPGFHGGYVWPIYDSYEIFSARADGSDVRRLTFSPGYDAEATISPLGDLIVFTSMRDGDPELYLMAADGSTPKRLTFAKGYDGGAFFSWDGKKIVYRAYHPETPEEIQRYYNFLKQGLIEATRLELFIVDLETNQTSRITRNGATNFAPAFHPNGRQVIFSSNLDDPKGRNFELYRINIDGTGLQRVTYEETFDGFPMFSRDGKKLVFASNRNAKTKGETNIFIADWKD